MASIGQSLAGTERLVEAGIAACWRQGFSSVWPVLRPTALASSVSGSLRQGPGLGLAFRLTSSLLAVPVARIARLRLTLRGPAQAMIRRAIAHRLAVARWPQAGTTLA